MDLTEALAVAPYPGRGLVACRLGDGLSVAYWLSGRSPASRNRVLVQSGEEIAAVDISGDTSDALRHYRCSHSEGRFIVVGNGDHVEDLAARTNAGATAFDGLLHQQPEPDPPIRTARLAAVVDRATWSVVLGAARAGVTSQDVDHIAVAADHVPEGKGLLVTTYQGQPEQPSTWASPIWVDTPSTLPDLLELTWSALDERFRVALAARCLESGSPWMVRSARES